MTYAADEYDCFIVNSTILWDELYARLYSPVLLLSDARGR